MPTYNTTGVIDLRSDTLTLPTPEMMQVIMKASTDSKLGDDVWNEDFIVKQLEQLVASKTGKEAGLFVPSGTQSNLIASITHCQLSRNFGPSEIIIGDVSHMASYEAGNISNIGSIYARQLPTEADGTISLDRIEATIKESKTLDVHFPATKMVALENTHNKRGGCVISVEYCQKVRSICDKYGGIALHLDGARVWNACVALKKDLKEVCSPFNSVSLCLSKGLGAPIGSVLVGSAEFIAVARRFRKVLGGGMRQSGLLAAAGIFAVENNFSKLEQDHDFAKRLGDELKKNGDFDVLPVHTNLVIWKCPVDGESAKFCQLCAKHFNVKLSTMGASLCRAVPHIGNKHSEDFDKVVSAIRKTKMLLLQEAETKKISKL